MHSPLACGLPQDGVRLQNLNVGPEEAFGLSYQSTFYVLNVKREREGGEGYQETGILWHLVGPQ